jgi:regulatory protein
VFKQALWFLKFRPRSEFEVRAYLAKKGGQIEAIDETVDKLKRMKFIDDEELAKFWLRRREARPRASWVIKLELGKLGVDKELVDRVMGDQKPLDRRLAIRLAEKLRGKPKDKIMATLARRGFDWETIKGVKSAL